MTKRSFCAGPKGIPCSNQITRLLDEAVPELFGGNFKAGIGQAEKYEVLEQYRVMDGGVLTAIDGGEVPIIRKNTLRLLFS